MCGDGEQTRQVWCKMVHAIPDVDSDILPDGWCDTSSRPADRQKCNAGSCSGAEWMNSEWLGVSCLSLFIRFRSARAKVPHSKGPP